MKLFFDTSALVKLFHEETGSKVVTELVTSPENEIWVCELVCIEFYSALFRRYRNREIDDDRLEEAILGFKEQYTSFRVEPVGQAVMKEAESLLQNFGKTIGLRALDALHLGAFALIRQEDWFFVAADENLCRAAKSMGFGVINPLEGQMDLR